MMRRIIKRALEPTLTRRLVLTVIGALGLIWAVLVAFQYMEVRWQERDNPALHDALATMEDLLQGVDDARAAAQSIASLDRIAARQRRREGAPVTVFMELRDAQSGAVVYLSDPAFDIADAPPGISARRIGGRDFHVAVKNGERWRFGVGQSSLPVPWLMRQLAADLAKYVLIALPLALVPVWLAVWLGLRPLRRLARSVARRTVDDTAPLQAGSPHAEIRTLVDAFDRLLARLSAALARERSFVQDAAHELRTPLAVVAVHAHAAAVAASEPARGDALRQLQGAVARAGHLVQQLLDLARMDAGAAPPSACDVAARVRDELATLAPLALARGIELSLEAPDRLERPVDESALHAVVGNLVDNAIRYGRPSGNIVVTLGEDGAGWQLLVADDGPGIDPEDGERIFGRFYRGRQREGDGSGLGLAIARAAAARLRATLVLEPGLAGRGCGLRLRAAGPA